MGVSVGKLNTSRSAPSVKPGPSPLGEAGKQFACDMDNAMENGVKNQHYLTLVYNNRRESDNTLVKIMLDPILSHLFRSYLYKYFKEALFNFWSECNAYALIPVSNLETKKHAAAHIYSTFLATDAPYSKDFMLDGPTRDQIAGELLITKTSSGDYKVKQNSDSVLQDVFRFPAAKVFQILKFEYFSDFLLSTEFQDNVENFIKSGGRYQGDMDEKITKKQRDEIVDIENVISQPSGTFYFLKFARANGLFSGQSQFVFDLLYEMNHYDNCDDPATKMKRLKKIIVRYKDFSFLIETSRLEEKAKKCNYKEPEDSSSNRSLLEELRQEIMQLLDNYSLPFKMSLEYREFKASKTVAQSEATLEKVRSFAKRRNLGPKTRISFIEMLNNRIGRAYFKRYAEKNLMAESIGFWLEIEVLRQKNTLMIAKKVPESEINSFIDQEVESIIKSYIEEGSDQQINISASQRIKTLELYKRFKQREITFEELFAVSSTEILELLKKNLWNGFRQNKQFQYLSEKVLEKDNKKPRAASTVFT